MPPGPVYNWLCVAHSVVNILNHAAQIKAAQMALRSGATTMTQDVVLRRKRRRVEDMGREEVEERVYGGKESGVRCSLKWVQEEVQEVVRPVKRELVVEDNSIPESVKDGHPPIEVVIPSSGVKEVLQSPVESKDIKPDQASAVLGSEGAESTVESNTSSTDLPEVSSNYRICNACTKSLFPHSFFFSLASGTPSRPSPSTKTPVFESTFVKVGTIISLWWYVIAAPLLLPIYISEAMLCYKVWQLP